MAQEKVVALSKKTLHNHIMNQDNNIWEQMETHMQENLGTYGLEMFNIFLHLKECAEDCGMCPEDTPERQEHFEDMHGEAHAPRHRI